MAFHGCPRPYGYGTSNIDIDIAYNDDTKRGSIVDGCPKSE